MRYLPYILAVVALAGFTAYQGIITDRWRDNVEAKECARLLKSIPTTIGDWVGVDQEVDPKILKTAGAEGYVSRSYVNSRTKEVVEVWFIVGHSFNISRHTPNVCYRAQGFSQTASEDYFKLPVEGEKEGTFLTATFKGDQAMRRVFWTWSKPIREKGDQVEWIAPDQSQGWFKPGRARGAFGNMRALYKLYFTAGVKPDETKPEDSVCVKFAQEFLPVANKILEQSVPSPGAETVGAPATKTDKTPATEPATPAAK